MQLIKQINGEFITESLGSITYINSISGEVNLEDYINLNGFIAYLQNFSRIETTSSMTQPIKIGLVNSNNIKMVTLEIDY